MVVLAGSLAVAAKPVLRVNGKEINDVSLNLAMRYAVRAVPPGPSQQESVLLLTVQQSILRTLLAQEARKAGLAVSPAEVAERVKEKRNQLAHPEVIDKIIAELDGSEADLVALEEEMLLADKFVQEKVAPSVTVTEADAKAYYEANPQEFEHPEQVKLRMIMAAVGKGASEEQRTAARARAAQARARVMTGEEFAAVARELSDDPSKSRGGEIGWVRGGMLYPELEAAVFALQPGQVSEVLPSERGFHVFRVEARRGPGRYPWEEIGEQFLQTLRARRLQERLAAVLGPIREAATVEILDPKLQELVKKHEAPSSAPRHP